MLLFLLSHHPEQFFFYFSDKHGGEKAPQVNNTSLNQSQDLSTPSQVHNSFCLSALFWFLMIKICTFWLQLVVLWLNFGTGATSVVVVPNWYASVLHKGLLQFGWFNRNHNQYIDAFEAVITCQYIVRGMWLQQFRHVMRG